MRSYIAVLLLLSGFHFTLFSQKTEFSVSWTPAPGVHSPTDFVVGSDGCIYLTGGARGGIPVTDDAFQKSYNGHNTWSGGDAYLMKLSPAGDLIYATYIGGTGGEESFRIASDKSGNIYVCGSTWSSDFPVTDKAFQRRKAGGGDNFIMKFNSDLQLVASTFLGGNGFDYPTTINIFNDKVCLAGRTSSTDFPVTANAYDTTYYSWQSPDNGWQNMVIDISVAVLSADLDSVLYATYLGGKNRDEIIAVSADKDNNLVLTGITWSDDYPVTSDCPDNALNGERDGFITVLNPTLSEIIFSTYIGGNAVDHFSGPVQIDDSNIVLLSGSTRSQDFPVTPDAMHENLIGGEDGFIMRFNLNTRSITYSSFFGGREDDEIGFISLYGENKYILAGISRSADFPTTPDASDRSFNGGYDIVLSVLDNRLKKIEYSTFIGGSEDDIRLRFRLAKEGMLFISLGSSKDFPVTKELPGSGSNGKTTLLKINLNK